MILLFQPFKEINKDACTIAVSSGQIEIDFPHDTTIFIDRSELNEFYTIAHVFYCLCLQPNISIIREISRAFLMQHSKPGKKLVGLYFRSKCLEIFDKTLEKNVAVIKI